MPLSTMSAETFYTEEQKAEVYRQLDLLLDNPHFSHSKRFPSFLRFIIREELEGRGDQLKERTLGIEVFGREAGYDTNSDPIVRVTAAEIRKRIAQYYQEAGDCEIRISLPSGSYVPHFEWLRAMDRTFAQPISSPPDLEFVSTSGTGELVATKPLLTDDRAAIPRTPWRRFAAAIIFLAVVAVAGLGWARSRPSTLDRFWAPMLNSSEPVVVCFPQNKINSIILRDASDPASQHRLDEQVDGVIVDDLQPLVSLSGLLDMRHQNYVLRGEDTSSLTDLRAGPGIFIGAFDNAWTLRMTRGLRFRFGNDAEMKHFWIEDTQSPGSPHWTIDRNQQEATNNYRDYAIVARFRDPNTGKLALVAAGIARGGTVAAGEFLTQPGNWESVTAHAPRNWDNQNMEFVLSTEIIDGRSGPPKVEATYFW